MRAPLLGWVGLVFAPTIAFADPPNCPATYKDLSAEQRAGEHTCKCVTSGSGQWGTGTYTADSSLCGAAMHAGAMDTQWKNVIVTVKAAPGCPTYAGSTANGVTSNAYGKYEASFYFPALSDGKCVEPELPKAAMKNAALENAVAAAYKRDYEHKVLKVILQGWDDDLEKDAFGRVTGRNMHATVVTKRKDGTCELHYELWLQRGNGRSFSGPLSARGAGSKDTKALSCAKVEKPAPAKKK